MVNLGAKKRWNGTQFDTRLDLRAESGPNKHRILHMYTNSGGLPPPKTPAPHSGGRQGNPSVGGVASQTPPRAWGEEGEAGVCSPSTGGSGER